VNWYRSGGLVLKLTSFDDGMEGRLTGRRGSSSSLSVKSMTSSRGRLLEVRDADVDATAEGSREELRGGVRTLLGVRAWKGFRFTDSARVSDISTRSSSSSSDGVGLEFRLFAIVGAATCRDHSPFGSIVTCSVSLVVESRISCT
jgi:hypothetical protein